MWCSVSTRKPCPYLAMTRVCNIVGGVCGPWPVVASAGSGATNVVWTVRPNVVIRAGTYTVVDSNPAPWSQNAGSGGKGFSEIRGAAAPVAPPATTSPVAAKVTITPIPQQQTYSPSVARSVAESNAAVNRIAGYLESGNVQAFLASLSRSARASVGRTVHIVARAARTPPILLSPTLSSGREG